MSDCDEELRYFEGVGNRFRWLDGDQKRLIGALLASGDTLKGIKEDTFKREGGTYELFKNSYPEEVRTHKVFPSAATAYGRYTQRIRPQWMATMNDYLAKIQQAEDENDDAPGVECPPLYYFDFYDAATADQKPKVPDIRIFNITLQFRMLGALKLFSLSLFAEVNQT
eukprot:m.122516 g.122516  ORF g.122516 m.122516 type:complete len:168 (+) comp23336_c0_seq4:182-685(+)